MIMTTFLRSRGFMLARFTLSSEVCIVEPAPFPFALAFPVSFPFSGSFTYRWDSWDGGLGQCFSKLLYLFVICSELLLSFGLLLVLFTVIDDGWTGSLAFSFAFSDFDHLCLSLS